MRVRGRRAKEGAPARAAGPHARSGLGGVADFEPARLLPPRRHQEVADPLVVNLQHGHFHLEGGTALVGRGGLVFERDAIEQRSAHARDDPRLLVRPDHGVGLPGTCGGGGESASADRRRRGTAAVHDKHRHAPVCPYAKRLTLKPAMEPSSSGAPTVSHTVDCVACPSPLGSPDESKTWSNVNPRVRVSVAANVVTDDDVGTCLLMVTRVESLTASTAPAPRSVSRRLSGRTRTATVMRVVDGMAAVAIVEGCCGGGAARRK